MTTISILEDAKAVLTTQKEVLENKRGDIYVREQKALGEALAGFYGVFPEEVEVEVTRGSVYFKMTHPDYSYKKELFNLYLKTFQRAIIQTWFQWVQTPMFRILYENYVILL
jgi:hypothetical protein